MSARSLRRLSIAVALALVAHAAAFIFAARFDHRESQPLTPPAQLRVQLRMLSPQAAPHDANVSVHADPARAFPSEAIKRHGTHSAAARQTANNRTTPAETVGAAATARIATPPPSALSEPPRLDSERVMQQVMQADRQRRAQRPSPPWAGQLGDSERAASSPFDALHSNQAGTRTESTTDSRGVRVEKVTTLRGSYCVSTPNGATAYRHENGLNLSGSGNCPR